MNREMSVSSGRQLQSPIESFNSNLLITIVDRYKTAFGSVNLANRQGRLLGVQFVSESVQGSAKNVSLQLWTITNTILRCWDVL